MADNQEYEGTPINIDDIPESNVVEATELYELTLEQALDVPIELDRNNRHRIRVQDFLDNGKFTGCIVFLSKRTDVNYTNLLATSLEHGLSIFQHEHEDVLVAMEELNDEMLINNYETYNKLYRNYKPCVDYGKPSKLIWTSPETFDRISHFGSTLTITCGQLATVCLCMSFSESTMLPTYITKECESKVAIFNRACNIVLDNLKQIRY